MIELFVVLALTTAIIGLAGALPDRRRVKRLLGAAHVQPIDTLEDGEPAVIRGEVVAAEVIAAPVTKRPCVYWFLTVDEVGTAGDFVELARAEWGQPFVVRDATGSARIVPENVRIAVAPVEKVQRFGEPIPIELRRRPNYPQSSKCRIIEYAVLPGATVTVMGFCTFEPNPDAPEDVTGYRTELPTRPVVSGSRRRPLLVG